MPQKETNNALEALGAELKATPNVLTAEVLEWFTTENGVRVERPVGVAVYIQHPETLQMVEVDYEPFDASKVEDADYRLSIANALKAGVMAELPKKPASTVGSRLPRKGRGSIQDKFKTVAYAEFE